MSRIITVDFRQGAMSAWREAIKLARSGLPVFPCRPDKKPYTRHGFKDATADLDQIRRWWTRWPWAFIGVPTGTVSGLLVVDVDPNGLGWYHTRADMFGCSRIHRTPRGGYHLLYQMPNADIRCSAGKISLGVDVRANGGYIIWWVAHGFEVTR